MTLFKPTILINRLLVMKDGRSVMDISFHHGLNIILGENSSGKTTAIRFIAFALGAENINFNAFAELCDDVFLEITTNEAITTLRRRVSTEVMQPLAFSWASLEQAISSSNWQQYPFRRSQTLESFSQIIFRILEVPELRGEGGANITMHQLLRLMYSDQETPSTDIFRHDRFDRAITRAAVGDYLLGIDSTELYELKLKEATDEKEVSALTTSIRTIYSTFGKSGTNVSLDFLDDQINNLASEVKALQEKLDNVNSDAISKATPTSEDRILWSKLSQVHSKLSEFKRSKVNLEEEIADSELFLRELEERLFSLEESAVSESYLGTAVFSFCPSCFSKLSSDIGKEDTSNETRTTCSLCKSDIASDSAKSQLARMRNEISLQVKESELIRVQQLEELQRITAEIPTLEAEMTILERDFKRNQQRWRSPDQIIIEKLSKEIGSKEQEIKNALELKKLADLLSTLSNKLGEAQSRLEWTKGRISAVTREQVGRREKAYLAVAENLKFILKSDLPRQAEFSQAQVIDIDFAANRVTIDKQSHFSASSMVYLRHGFHLALLLASLEHAYFRYPRLLILDGIEDGGMEADRSYNFQELIQRLSDASHVTHQIIMTTTDLSPKLDQKHYLVGRKFTHDKKSLNIV